MRAYSLEEAKKAPLEVNELTLQRKNLDHFPEVIMDCKNIQKLDLSHNNISFIPAETQTLLHLKELKLQNNSLIDLTTFSWNLPNLEVLDLSHNKLSFLPPTIKYLKNLKTLNLSGNRIKKLPKEIGQLLYLTRLDINNNKLSVLPKALQNCIQLSILSAANNKLISLPEFVSPWRNLHTLDISNNKLTEIPNSIGHCLTLRLLILKNNKLKKLPIFIGKLSWLATLDLSNNQISVLPNQISQCVQIQALYLSNNQLETIPEQIIQLKYLRRLDIKKNGLQQLPQLPPNLLDLNISTNKLEYNSFKEMELPKLQQLDMSKNRITKLPAFIGKSLQLNQLDIRENQLLSFPDPLLSLDKLVQLKGYLKGENRRFFLRFIKACQKVGLPLNKRKEIYNIVKASDQELEQIPLETLTQALKFPLDKIQNKVRIFFLYKWGKSLDQNPIKKKSRITLLGQHNFSKEVLKKFSLDYRISFSRSIDAQTTHILLGRPPFKVELKFPKEVSFIIERDLSLFFYKHVRPYLWANPNPEKLNHLKQLIFHRDSANILLAIQMLKGGGVPNELLSEIFITWKFSKTNQVKRELRNLLELHLTEAGKQALRKKVSINVNLPQTQLEKNIKQLTEGNELEERKILEYLEGQKK